VVSTETIAAGINLPARTVVFPALRKFIKAEARLVTPAEFHQMAGRAGRPQFDDRGYAIALAPEEVVTELKKELKDAAKRPAYDESRVKKNVYNRARSDAQRKGEVTWSPEAHAALVTGEPAELRSRTKITAEQVLAIGLPDLTVVALPGAVAAPPTEAERITASLPAALRLDIVSVIDNLLLDERERRAQHKTLAMLVANLRAIDVIDEQGNQVSGWMIRKLQGMDGPFIYHALSRHPLDYDELRALVEFLVDHDVVQRVLDRKLEHAKREWIKARLRELRAENGQVAWEDAEAQWHEAHPRELTRPELLQQEFAALVPHPELHGGKKPKDVWARLEDGGFGFLEFVERESLQHEEGSLFTYLVRMMNTARTLHDASELPQLRDLADRIRAVLFQVDPRL